MESHEELQTAPSVKQFSGKLIPQAVRITPGIVACGDTIYSSLQREL